LLTLICKKSHIVIKGRPCKILEISTGPDNVHVFAIDIFTENKLEEVCPPTKIVDVPNITGIECHFICTKDGFMHLIKPDGSEKNDVKVPGGKLGSRIMDYEKAGTAIVITVVSAMGEEGALRVQEVPK
jgi:translation initiation factor 5A